MGTGTISLSDDVEKRFRETITRECGNKKGALSSAITEAIELWIKEVDIRSLAEEGRRLLAKEHDIGKWQYSNRKELYERT
ncbi:hypothetical protein ACKUB1_07270 [Methanospirillum stamsii]|uniref:XACb0070 ribbon-helix-helix domain-containing protein n=1 Tax=Methanospirillum stamsii TaxID=1277351 RepID=A0A2V2NBQ3_9EURY|nr:hypothetical protein [Methanospirillum stamsii]PWR76170.1 hypothetical protein DLD82_01370 [Methanospirillum stamsii]